jgi:23S rRNA-/tRNA-specific pseudouridylate synthase
MFIFNILKMNKSKIILIHLFLWLLVFFTFFNILNALGGFPKKTGYNPYNDLVLYGRAISTTFMLTIPFYFGYLISPFLFKRKRRDFFVTAAVLFGIFFPVFMSVMDDGLKSGAVMQSVFLFAFLNTFLILGLSFRSLFGLIEQKRLQEQLEKQNLKSELDLLRTQLNPHFLFNTLHNIDSLIHDDQEKASNSLVKLSDIMRYMLQDAKSETVLMEKELEYLYNYISLERLRFKNEKFLDFETSGNFQGVKIAPMLFIPFVENAFKHSVDSEVEKGILIRITNSDKKIRFTCENQYDKSETDKDKMHGIGLETVKKRLDIVYPDKHLLIIDKDNNNFKVTLEININDN